MFWLGLAVGALLVLIALACCWYSFGRRVWW